MIAEFGVECALITLPALAGSGDRETMNLTDPLGFDDTQVAVKVTALGGIL
jgi:hypothetical protein